MSTAIDLYALSNDEVVSLSVSIEAMEDFGSPHLVLWGLTNIEIDQLASWLDQPATASEPLMIRDDEGKVTVIANPIAVDLEAGAYAFSWSDGFAAALADLTPNQVQELSRRLKELPELEGLSLEELENGMNQLSALCSSAREGGKMLVQFSAI